VLDCLWLDLCGRAFQKLVFFEQFPCITKVTAQSIGISQSVLSFLFTGAPRYDPRRV